MLCREILRVDPLHAESLHLLGLLAHRAGRHNHAAQLIGKAIAQDGSSAPFHYHLGNTLLALRRWQDAAACFEAAIALQSDHVSAYTNLGSTLTLLGQPDRGIACFRKAVELRPDDAKSHYNLGNALARRWHLDEAVRSLGRSVAIRPDADAYNTLGNLLREVGEADRASVEYDKGLHIDPGNFALRSNRLLVENYRPDRPPGAMLSLAKSFGALASSQVTRPFEHRRIGIGDGPLRVGLVSGDLHNHPVGYFLERLLSTADSCRMVFLAFPTQLHEDDLTARIKRHVLAWEPLAGMDDEAAARLIHSHGVQVLLDLSGHTAGNRLPVFSWRPAPVQATWLGYFATTGLSEIDYFISDPNVSPPGAPTSFLEKPCLLPELYYCFTPPAATEETSALPARSNGFLTFGCFNNLAKINDALIAVWARLLHAVPASRLMLKAAPLGNEEVRSVIRARFASRAISAERLSLEGPSTREEYLRTYHRVDMALDPFPFPGGATTFEALWMGVPVLTKKGDRFVSRMGETIMRNAGLTDWIAADEDDYIIKAAGFASDLDQLARLRERLRERVLASPLYDSGRFARHFEAALRDLWAHTRASQAGCLTCHTSPA